MKQDKMRQEMFERAITLSKRQQAYALARARKMAESAYTREERIAAVQAGFGIRRALMLNAHS